MTLSHDENRQKALEQALKKIEKITAKVPL